ncbi:alpha/beta hydrolase [Kineobactrum salinum]|uniref:Alpha/beta hydrolase n=1 Tax=Kineobactrum salinum TaxID=2708301 RepID=A0A6C0U5N3_9GAMM|nr:alpha/beta hydrolase [Kineobactrum salinum]QIB67248.1 alpha/beta hydrolase [Kineobactrum salinum]
MIWLVFAIVAWFLVSIWYLRGEDLAALDEPALPLPGSPPSEAHHAVVARLGEFSRSNQARRGKARLQVIRGYLDSLSDGREFGASFEPAAGPVRGEWVQAPGADSRRRLLYLHGGAWFAGSPKSHRAITDRLARLTGAAVLALDYRLLPEHRRRDGIEDSREAWRWILDHGPCGAEAADSVVVAGDSAGGSLALGLLAWIRDEGLRQANAAVVFSPSTDLTLSSPSLRSNLASDPMLGPAFGALARIPALLLLWATWYGNRLPPSHPDISPLRGDLAGLPPILIQVSEQEMLLDDARRYTAKARRAGSPVTLQSWPHMVHVWQMFTPELPEAEAAYKAVARFLAGVGVPVAEELPA